MPRILLLWLLGTLTILLFVGMVIYSAPLEPSIPTIQFSFNEATFNSVLAQWGPSGVARFKTHFAIDFPFLVSYGLFGYLLSQHTSLLKKLPALVRSLLSWALPAAAAMDAAENLLHLHFISGATAIPSALYLVAGVVVTIKWMLIAAFAIGAGYAGVHNAG